MTGVSKKACLHKLKAFLSACQEVECPLSDLSYDPDQKLGLGLLKIRCTQRMVIMLIQEVSELIAVLE